MKNTLLVIVVIVVVSIGIAVNYFQFKRAIEELPTKSEFRQLAWQFAMDIPKPTNAILTDVGVIQFLDNGFSISLDSADWKSEGLILTGTLGNSTNLQVSSLTLKITAQKTMYSLHKEFMESESIYPSYLFILPKQIGTGQTSVGTIEPGGTSTFRITIPNVRSTDEELTYKVTFSGERYTY